MLVTSRSYAEYRAMFGLAELPRSVLDCCAGGSGFTAVAAAEGADAVAVDPAYELSDRELADAVRSGTSTGGNIVDQYSGDFTWHWYGSREERDRMRAEAVEQFLGDRTAHPERYVAASLPHLPFNTGRFELALCSHLLFLYSEQLDAAFHIAAVQALLRVAQEARIFPLLALNCEVSPHLALVIEWCKTQGHHAEVRRVPYEFQVGGDRMLHVQTR